MIGSVKMPADMLQGKAKREYEAPSPVVTSSVYDRIVPVAEFKKLTKRERTLHLYEWRKRFSTKEICEGLGLNDLHQVYYLYRAYGVGNPKKGEKPAARESPTVHSVQASRGIKAAAAPASSEEELCDVRICGKLSGRDLTRKLQGLAMMAMEDGCYELDLRFTEL